MVIIPAAIYFTAIFVLIEYISRKSKMDKELSRKLAHILAGISVAYLPSLMSFNEIAILALLFLPVMLISKKRNLFSSIHEVSRKTYGEVYFPISILIVALLFPDKQIFIYGVLVMSLSDGLAGIIGQKYGKKKFKLWQGEKSYVGSLVFLITTLLIGLLIGIQVPIWAIFVTSVILTLIEACLSDGIDNLLIPPFACGILVVAMSLFN